MSKQNPPPRKLGRGISSLMNLAPVRVDVPPTQNQTDSAQSAGSPAAPTTAAVGGPSISAPAIPSAAAIHNLPIHDDSGNLLGHMRHIALVDVVPNQFQPRRTFDDATLSELATSIRALGVVQPIVVRQLTASTYTGSAAGTRYELIAGERRWRAAQLVGLDTIPAVVRTATDRESASMALAENVQRAELNPIEVGSALARLHSAFNMSQSDIAAEVGLERPTVTNLIRLLDLPASIRDLVASGALSKGHAKVLLTMEAPAPHVSPDQDRRVSLAKKAAEQGWSIRKLEDAARLLAASAHASPTIEAQAHARPITRFEANLADLEKHLGEKLGTRVKIKPQKGDKGRTKGRIIIAYYDLDHFAGVMGKITGDGRTGPE